MTAQLLCFLLRFVGLYRLDVYISHMEFEAIQRALLAVKQGASDLSKEDISRLAGSELIRWLDGRWQLTEAGQVVLDALSGKLH
jgi:hypothetical protein